MVSFDPKLNLANVTVSNRFREELPFLSKSDSQTIADAELGLDRSGDISRLGGLTPADDPLIQAENPSE